MIDFSAYFGHIGYAGERKPALHVLQELHLRHTLSIPFENLSPWTGLEVKLDIPSLLDKFTQQKRGGYCYEHNLLFKAVLESLGFQTKSLAARVRWNVPDNISTPRSHMLLMVAVEGSAYLADTGFGGLTMTHPVAFRTGVPQETPHGLYRLVQQGDAYRLEGKLGEEWKVLYVFDLTEQILQDYEVSSWYLSHHPNSLFVRNLIAALPTDNGRHALMNNHYSFYPLNGDPEHREIASATALKDLLESQFLIAASSVPGFQSRFEHLVQDGL
jgi:N-hydroxyarylamine O-acetyltransferase